jgi:hypothetical protein
LNQTLPDGFDEISCWHIKLAWSEYKDGHWSPKQTGLPFVVSNAFVKPITRNVTPPKVFFQPDHVTVTTEIKGEILGFEVLDYTYTTRVTRANLISYDEDPMLHGTVIEKDGDWAAHEHHEVGVTMLSLLPKPANHYLDAKVDGTQLTIRVFARFEGKPSGQFRTTKEDRLTIVRDGSRTERK